jgi:hypothetical protein
MAIICSLHLKYTQNTDYTRYRELVCSTWMNNSSSSTHLNVSAICCPSESPNCSRFHVICFWASWVWQKQLHCWIVHVDQPHYQIWDGIPGPLRSPPKNPVGFYWGDEEATRLVRPTQSVCLEMFFHTVSHCKTAVWRGAILLKENVWLKVCQLRNCK